MSKASDDGTKASTTVVGRTLASVLSHTGGEGVGGKGRLQYPRHVLAVEATEQKIVDEKGLRCAMRLRLHNCASRAQLPSPLPFVRVTVTIYISIKDDERAS